MSLSGATPSRAHAPLVAARGAWAAVCLSFSLLQIAGCSAPAATSIGGAETASPPAAAATAAEAYPLPMPEPDPEHAARETSGPAGLVVYSGRTESLVGPLIEAFEATSGLQVDVRYGDTGELAVTLLEEGDRSPADVFFAQEPGGLGEVAAMLAPLPADVLGAVEPQYRAADGSWVGISGRARVVVFNTDKLMAEDLPADIRAFIGPEWKGRVGWAPANASFQSMVTAMRRTWGEDETRRWVEGMVANGAVAFPKNGPIVQAVADGEIDVGFVNHYYLYGFLAEEGEAFKARNAVLREGGPASILLVAGAAILKTAAHPEAAERFVRFLQGTEAQHFFAERTWEYPLSAGVQPDAQLPALAELKLTSLDLSALDDIAGSVAMLRDAGALP